MAPRTLAEPYQTLLHQMIETMLAGNGGKYPESHSDMNYCVRGLLKMYDVKRRPLAIDLPYADEAVEHRVQADFADCLACQIAYPITATRCTKCGGELQSR